MAERKGSILVISKGPSVLICLAVLLGFSSVLAAQQPGAPTLNEILERLEANLNHFDSSVPSFFCDEHVLSHVASVQGDRNTVTESTFRLQRKLNADHTTELVESREIKSVDGKAPTSQDIEGPSLLKGAFEGALDVVSPNQAKCMRYKLQPIKSKYPEKPYSIRFATDESAADSAACILHEKSTGEVLVDPASMQVTHVEITTPHHTIIPGGGYVKPVIGKRVLMVDYAPVELDGKTFWMPAAITMHATSGTGTYRLTNWSFQATYKNYHRMEVKSRILPGSATPVQ